jgi:hypothetical protein
VEGVFSELSVLLATSYNRTTGREVPVTEAGDSSGTNREGNFCR